MDKDFSGIIEYLDQKFVKIDNDFKELKDNFSLLQASVDAYAVKADKYFHK